MLRLLLMLARWRQRWSPTARRGWRARGDKLWLLRDVDPAEDVAALRETLMAEHLRRLDGSLRRAWHDGSHPARDAARIAEARVHAADLLRAVAHLGYVNDVIPAYLAGGRIGLTVVLRTPYLPPGLRDEVPWLFRAFETRCLPREG